MEHDEDMEGMDHDEGGEATIPNDGATIRLLSPADHTTVKASDEFLVEVEVENFPLGEEGNHWHIEVDGDVYQMIMGGNTEWSVRGLEPGEHDISVHLSNGTHQQLEDGDSITLIVEE
jgi:hypothetical protein